MAASVVQPSSSKAKAMRKGTRERKEKKTKKWPRRNEGNDDDDDDDKKEFGSEKKRRTGILGECEERRDEERRKRQGYDGEGFARRRRTGTRTEKVLGEAVKELLRLEYIANALDNDELFAGTRGEGMDASDEKIQWLHRMLF